MSEKVKVLCWADSPTVSTGFGVVARHVIGALNATGKYEIHQLAINHDGKFVEDDKIDWQIQPAKLLKPDDPYGNQMFVNAIAQNDYDLIWIVNDNYVTHGVAKSVREAINRRAAENKKVPLIVYYYPVDCQVVQEGSGMLEAADIVVAYTNHGRLETIKTLPKLEAKIEQIPHGVQSSVFKPLPEETIRSLRKQHFNVDDDTYVIANINRNTTRKQIPYTLLAFKEFRRYVPNSILYIHAAFHDQGGDLLLATRDLGFDLKKDVIYPVNYGPGNGISDEALNGVYNTADLYFSTHLGEGWGLTISEAMSAGTPVLVPNNTCMPQLIGTNEERGYMYECTDTCWIDNSGFRPKGVIPDIVDRMLHVHGQGRKQFNPKVRAAREWAVEHDWKNIGQQWVELFDRIIHRPAPVTGRGDVV